MKSLPVYVLTAIVALLLGATPVLAGELHDAAERGDVKAVKSLLDGGTEVNAKDSKGWTALNKAVFKGSEDVVRLLIDAGADVNTMGPDGVTPLHAAAFKGHADIARILIEKSAEVDARTSNFKQTPLHWAALKGNEEVAGLLIEKGADLNARDYEEGAPLHMAAMEGHLNVARLLIERGAKLDAKDSEGLTPLHWTALRGNADVAGLLIMKGADLSATTSKLGYTPLHLSAMKGNEEVAGLLIEKGADVNARDFNGWSPLYHAVSKGQAGVKRLLLEKRPEADAKGPQGLSTSPGKLEAMLPLGDVVAEVLNVEFSERLNELSEKMLLAMAGKQEWMQEYILENSKPGEPLPYHPNFGLTESEYKEYLQCAETEKRLVTKAEIVITIERQGGTYRISSRGMLPSMDDIVIHADELRAKTRYGTLTNPEWETSDGSTLLLGEWEGYVWKLHEGSVLDGNTKGVSLDLLHLSTGKTFMNLRATVTEDGEPTVAKDINLRFDSALSK